MKTEDEVYVILFSVQNNKLFHEDMIKKHMDRGAKDFHKARLKTIETEIRVLKHVLGIK